MATRNPANEIEFNKVNFGAPVTVYQITDLGTNPDTQVSPNEDVEAVVEAAQQMGTVLGLGAITEAGGVYTFNMYVENSAWAVADLEAAIQATGGIFSGASVTEAGL